MDDSSSLADIFRTLDLSLVIEILAVVLGAALLIVVSQRLLPWIASRLHGKRRLRLLAMVPVLRLLIIIGAFLIIVPMLIEPSLQNMVALLGTVGLALGFALKDLASSLFAGVVAVSEMPYRNGDWVRIDGVYGEVKHIGLRSVQILTPNDDLVSMPHSCLWNTPIHNSNDGAPRLQCIADFYLHPDHDGVRVQALLTDVAMSSPYLYFEQPVVVVAQERSWGTHYRLKAYPIDASQQFRFVTDLTLRGKAALVRLGLRYALAPAVESPSA